MEQNKMFTVSIEKEFDVFKKEFNNSVYLRVYTSLFQAGIVKELKPTNFTVLLAIASFMDAEGNCYPTQRQIADITGLTAPTVNKAVNELLDFKVNDNPILKREMVQLGQFKNSYYTVNPISQIAIFEGNIKELKQEPEELVKDSLSAPLKNFYTNKNHNTIPNTINNADNITFKNSKEVAEYFLSEYQKKYNVQGSINWRRDVSMIKNKIIGNYSNIQIKKMIDTIISDYETRWKKPNYPRPTISMMCSWLGEQALAVSEDAEKEFKELQELTADSETTNTDVLKKFGL